MIEFNFTTLCAFLLEVHSRYGALDVEAEPFYQALKTDDDLYDAIEKDDLLGTKSALKRMVRRIFRDKKISDAQKLQINLILCETFV